MGGFHFASSAAGMTGERSLRPSGHLPQMGNQVTVTFKVTVTFDAWQS